MNSWVCAALMSCIILWAGGNGPVGITHQVLGVEPNTILYVRDNHTMSGASVRADAQGCISFSTGGGGTFEIATAGLPSGDGDTLETAAVVLRSGGNPIFPSKGGAVPLLTEMEGKRVTATSAGDLTPAMTLYPNPTRGRVELLYTSATNSAALVAIADASGRSLGLARALSVREGMNTWKVDLREIATRPLAPGIYWVTLNSGRAFLRAKVMLLPKR